MVVSLRALCIGHRQARESHLTRFRSMQRNSLIDFVDSLQNKVRDQTKRHTILVGCGMLVATTAETKAHVYLFGQNDQNFRDNRTVPLVKRYVHWNTTDFIHATLAVILKGSVVILYRVTIQKHFPDRTKEVRIT